MHEETKLHIDGVKDVDKIVFIIHESRQYKPKREKYAKQSNIQTFASNLCYQEDRYWRQQPSLCPCILGLDTETMQASTAPSAVRSLFPAYDLGPPGDDEMPKVGTVSWINQKRTRRTTPPGPTKTQIAFRVYFVSSNKTET